MHWIIIGIILLALLFIIALVIRKKSVLGTSIEHPNQIAQPNAENDKMEMANLLSHIMGDVYNPYGLDHTNPNNYSKVATILLTNYTERHFQSGFEDKVLLQLRKFVIDANKYRLFDMPNTALSTTACALINCEDNSEIRAWGADLLGRCGNEECYKILVDLVNKEVDANVKKEAVAAITKFLRFRYKSTNIIKYISNTIKLNRVTPTLAEQLLIDELEK